MRSLLLLLVLAFTSVMATHRKTQTFTVLYLKPMAQAPADMRQMEAKTRVKNLTGNTLSLKWTRIEESLPGNWDSAVGDDRVYAPTKQSHTLHLLPWQERDFKVVFYPHNTTGTGSVKVSIYDPADNSEPIVVTFDGKATTPESWTKKQNGGGVKVYPNPAVEYIQVEENDVVNRIELYNMVGSKVATFYVNAKNEQYNISYLPRGIYLVRLVSANGQILYTQKLSKHNP